MAPPQDPYNTLGVPVDALPAVIRTAYKKKALACHPDKEPNEALKAQKQDEFQRVQQAYELLSDAVKRARYDERVRLATERALNDRMQSMNMGMNMGMNPKMSPPSYGMGGMRQPPTTSYNVRTAAPPSTEAYAPSRPRNTHHSPLRGESAPDVGGFPRSYERPERNSGPYGPLGFDRSPGKGTRYRPEDIDEPKRRRDKDERRPRKEEPSKRASGPPQRRFDDAKRSSKEDIKLKEREREREREKEKKRTYERERKHVDTSRTKDRRKKRDDEYSEFDDFDAHADTRKTSRDKKERSYSADRQADAVPQSPATIRDWKAKEQDAQKYIEHKLKNSLNSPSPQKVRRNSADNSKKNYSKSYDDDTYKPSLARGQTFSGIPSHGPAKLNRSSTMESGYGHSQKHHSHSSPRLAEEAPSYSGFRHMRAHEVPTAAGMYSSSYSPMHYDAQDYGTSYESYSGPPVNRARHFGVEDVQYAPYPTSGEWSH